MSEKYGCSLDLETLWNTYRLFGAYETIEEILTDLEEACVSIPENISFQAVENFLVLKLKFKVNKRDKHLEFKLEKSKLSLEDSNKFLI